MMRVFSVLVACNLAVTVRIFVSLAAGTRGHAAAVPPRSFTRLRLQEGILRTDWRDTIELPPKGSICPQASVFLSH